MKSLTGIFISCIILFIIVLTSPLSGCGGGGGGSGESPAESPSSPDDDEGGEEEPSESPAGGGGEDEAAADAEGGGAVDDGDCAPFDAGVQVEITNASGSTECVADDDDDDDDGIGDADDNCERVWNESQEDAPDGDGVGNACDDDDNDNGVADADDPDDDRLTFWVSADPADPASGADAAADDRGAIGVPFATIEAALADSADLVPPRNIYVVDGVYEPGRIEIPEGVSLYGGWGFYDAVSGTRPRDAAAFGTVIRGPGSPVGAIAFPAGGTSATVIDSFEIESGDNAGMAVTGISIVDASPTISHNRITSGGGSDTNPLFIRAAAGDASPLIESNEILAGAGTASSIAISIAADGGSAAPTIRDNTTIEGGAVTGATSTSAGIQATASAGGTLTLTIEDNSSISGGSSEGRSLGIFIVEQGAGASATAEIRRNRISGPLDPATAGPLTVGLVLGTEDDLRTLPIRSAVVEENTIVGGAGTTSSAGIDGVVKGGATTLIANNIIVGRTGTGGATAIGVGLSGTADRAWLVQNTIRGGEARDASVALSLEADLAGEESRPQIINNIFTADGGGGRGISEGCAACDPTRLETNLFDTALAVYYADADGLGLLSNIDDVNGANDAGRVDVDPPNLAGDPAFLNSTDVDSASYLRIDGGSAAIDGGQDTSAIDVDGAPGAEIEISTDIDGDLRTVGSYDIGADER